MKEEKYAFRKSEKNDHRRADGAEEALIHEGDGAYHFGLRPLSESVESYCMEHVWNNTNTGE